MINIFFELDNLRIALQDRGVDIRTVNNVVAKARQEIEAVFSSHGKQALDSAVEVGVQKHSPEFINDLHLDAVTFEVDTESGQLDFSEPPRPMMPYLLKNAKPMKDGSGFYKVVPVGKPGDRASVSSSIVDLQKKITAERAEQAKERERDIAPSGSKINFRTVTTKQDPQKQWVQPAKDKDFTAEVKQINEQLASDLDSSIHDIIDSYLEMF